MKREIIPVILAKNFSDFKKKLAIISTLRPKPKMIQIDVVDGKFAPFKTYNAPHRVAPLLKEAAFEMDLMVTNPLKHAKAWIKTGARRVLFHIEFKATKKPQKVIENIKSRDVEVGVSLNPNTPIEMIVPFVKQINAVLLLGVNPGKSGQKFQPKVLKKIRDLRQKYPALAIEVDGGVKLDNAALIFKAGATRLAAATAIVGAKNPQKAYKQLLKVASQNF